MLSRWKGALKRLYSHMARIVIAPFCSRHTLGRNRRRVNPSRVTSGTLRLSARPATCYNDGMMREMLDVLERIHALTTSGRSAALATVIATSGSTYRRPGARLLIDADDAVGSVSAGCLEDEIVSVARNVLDTGRPRLTSLDTREEMDKIAGTGLGCRGTIDVLIEPLTADGGNARVYRQLYDALHADTPCQLALVADSSVPNLPVGHAILRVDGSPIDDDALGAGWEANFNSLLADGPTATGTLELADGTVRIYAESIEPPPRLLVFGAGFDAVPLVKLASQLGFRITIVDPRESYLTPERFPAADELQPVHPPDIDEALAWDDDTSAVVMTHNYLQDLEILKRLLPSDIAYVGQMGPRDRTEELLADLEADIGPLADEIKGKLHGPIGLDVGAETPDEIALSIVSELLAVRRGREAGFLRERHAPIH